MNKKTIAYVLLQLTHNLVPIYGSERAANANALWILQWVTKKTHAYLIAHGGTLMLTAEQEQVLNEVMTKIINQHMPIAYSIGEIPFLNLTLTSKPPILIPRVETEYWCNWLIEKLAGVHRLTILDLCTGSGCIGLSLAQAFKNANVYAGDDNPQAIALAEENAKSNGISNITFFHSNLFEQIPQNLRFDLIVSNPPYVTETQWKTLDPTVRLWEDPHALIASDDGMAIINAIIEQAPAWLTMLPDTSKANIPQLVIEMDPRQTERAKEFCKVNGFKDVSILKDLNGCDRVVVAG